MTDYLISDTSKVPSHTGYEVLRELDGIEPHWLVTLEAGSKVGVMRRLAADSRPQLRDICGRVEHALGLLDAWTERDGSLVVVEEYAPYRLVDQLDTASSGELVTILVPLLETLDSMCQLGWKPDSLQQTDVVIDDTGRARLVNDIPLSFTPVGAEYILSLSGIADLIARLPKPLSKVQRCSDIIAELLVSYEPRALELREPAPNQSAPLRMHPELFDNPPIQPRTPRERVSSFLEGALVRARVFRDRLGMAGNGQLRSRRILWVAGGVAALTVVGLLAIPTGSAPVSVSAPSLDTAEAPISPPDADASSAVMALLDARSKCVSQQSSARCLEATDQVGSGLIAEDSERIAAGERLRVGNRPDSNPTVVSVMGDATLLKFASETNPASVLLVQTEAG